MVTIKQALTNTHGVSIRRTIKDLKVGEAFKWKDELGSPIRAFNLWCVKLNPAAGLKVSCDNEIKEYLWCYIEGNVPGRILYDDGKAEIHQP